MINKTIRGLLTCLLSVAITFISLPLHAEDIIYGPPRTSTNQVGFPTSGGWLYDLNTNSNGPSSSYTNTSTPMMGLVAYSNITLNGNNVTIDSFNSAGPSYSPIETNTLSGTIPVITKLVRVSPGMVGVTYTNCSETNFTYALQYSTNLIVWQTYQTIGAPTSTNTHNVTPPGNFPAVYYRIEKSPVHPVPWFPMALIATSSIELNGNGVRFDSFNSSDTNRSTFGLYDATKISDHGDIGVTSSSNNSLEIGNAFIYGKVHTGPSSQETTVFLGPNGQVGDFPWHEFAERGIQPGFWLTDMNLTFPSVTAPSAGGLPPQSGIYQGTSYNYLLSISGVKYESALSLNGKMMVTGTNVVLWAKAGMNLSGNGGGIYLAPGASLTVYVGTATGSAVSCNFTGTGGVNTVGVARNFQLYGLPSLTTISTGRSFTGAIYAPQATLSRSGGPTESHIAGALVVKSVTFNGHAEVHFDEDLKANGPFR